MTTRSRQHERSAAAALDLTPTAASGSRAVKNDARADRDGRAWPESAEFKTTGSVYYRLNLDDLVKAARQAGQDQRSMIFGIEFQNSRGPSWRYVILEESGYLDLIAQARA